MPDLHETIRGARFFDGHMPRLVDSLERIAIAIERVADKLEEAEDSEPKIKSEPKNLTRPPFPTNSKEDL